MSTLREVSATVNCPECEGSGFDMFTYDSATSSGQPCLCCGGEKTIPLSEVAERTEWSSGLCCPDEWEAEAEAVAALENMDL